MDRTQAASVQCGVANTVVIRESCEEDAGKVSFFQITRQARRRCTVILKEGGIGIDLLGESLAQNQFCLGQVERGMELGAPAALNAMLRPEGLQSVAQLDVLERPFAGMGRGEGRVTGRMPVLGKNDVLKSRRDAVDDFDDGVSVGDGKCATGAEIVLYVGDDENISARRSASDPLCRKPANRLFILSNSNQAGLVRSAAEATREALQLHWRGADQCIRERGPC